MAEPEWYARHPSVFLNGAVRFRAAADALCTSGPAPSVGPHDRVIYNLYHHAVELILKAYIVAKCQPPEPVPWGHDLVKLLQRAQSKGLPVYNRRPNYVEFFVETLHSGNESENY